MKRIITYFLQGLILVAPIVITGYIIYMTFNFVDGLLSKAIENWFGKFIPGLGIVFLFIVITLLGYIGQTIIAHPVKSLVKRILVKAPLLNVIYTSLTDLFSAFVGKEKKFNKPVLVCINKENNLYKIGFITQDSLDDIGIKGLMAVYFPHSYNFSGELYMVDSGAVKVLDMHPAEAMKFVVSGGVTRLIE